MRRRNTESVAEVIMQFLREQGLEKPFLEHKLIEAWPRVFGPMIAKYTGTIEIKNGVLFVQIHSAALRQELFLCRFQLVQKLNKEVGAEVIKDIRLL
ncbi:MAG: DUF721 domain-containing protein [Paludibacter sp.]|nr:DUF721 domain-containing protein [Bacteroidales bacterium]MCM1068973.1 DUF721 domain-containing protein [Prevotella sp.]MCM1353636.1 DUF721 domain-containing protein [Bacteroides sp.]MCM1442015.1 DUF721 domain-containing protein [Muribaculum sp.]MCM1481529.1 DUF721 domain-containing protein [Paludibacter sp.]